MPMYPNEEVREIAALALRNAFWHDFSALCNTYIKAAEGLDVPDQEAMLGELTNIYGRDKSAVTDEAIGIYTLWRNKRTCGHATMAEALEQAEADEIYLQSKKVLKRRDGEWYFVR